MKRSALFNLLERIMVVSLRSIRPKTLSVFLLRVLLAVIVTLKLLVNLMKKIPNLIYFALIRR